MTEQKATTEAKPQIAETTAEDAVAVRTAEQRREAVQKEYGEFIAVEPIDHDGARAYNVGDPVPAANVERWDYLGRKLVARQATKAAEQAVQGLADGPGRHPSTGA